MFTLKMLSLGLSAATAYVVFKALGAVVVYQDSQISAALKFAGLE